MEKTIQLVNLWGDYAKTHPKAEIEDFCRHLLIHKREEKKKEGLVGGVVPAESESLLLKIIGRIHKLHVNYISKVFEGTPLNQIEEFGLLATIKMKTNPIKSDVIASNILEPSSGTDMLNRLKKKGLIKEYPDKTDRRSKRVELTKQGEKTFAQCKEKIGRLAKMMLDDMTEDDRLLCIQLLQKVEIKFSGLFIAHRNLRLEEIEKSVASK